MCVWPVSYEVLKASLPAEVKFEIPQLVYTRWKNFLYTPQGSHSHPHLCYSIIKYIFVFLNPFSLVILFSICTWNTLSPIYITAVSWSVEGRQFVHNNSTNSFSVEKIVSKWSNQYMVRRMWRAQKYNTFHTPYITNSIICLHGHFHTCSTYIHYVSLSLRLTLITSHALSFS